MKAGVSDEDWGETRVQARAASYAWALAIAVFLCLMIALGGVSVVRPVLLQMQTALSLLLLIPSLLRLRGVPFSAAQRAALWIAALTLLLVLLQLLPLPPGIWQLLPGRSLVAQGLSVIGFEPGWMPLTLSPEGTRMAALSLLPGLAVFAATLSLSPRRLFIPVLALVLCAVANALLGLAQKSQGADSLLYFYGSDGRAHAVGTFANRNFLGTQLFTAIPFIVALAGVAVNHWRVKWWPVAVLASAYIVLMLFALGAVGTRSGMILSMVATLLSVFMLKSGPERRERTGQGSSRVAILSVVMVLLVLSQVGMAALLRIANTDVTSDVRGTINRVTIGQIAQYFPTGSGMGTFVPVYQLAETPEVMQDDYINHAHNDWFEVLLEGGLPAMLLLAAFLIWFVRLSWRAWTASGASSTAILQMAASTSALLILVHATVDYPLRTPAILTIFAFCCAVLCLTAERLMHKRKPVPPRPMPAPASSGGPRRRPFEPRTPSEPKLDS
jgi:O-antigen ligase